MEKIMPYFIFLILVFLIFIGYFVYRRYFVKHFIISIFENLEYLPHYSAIPEPVEVATKLNAIKIINRTLRFSEQELYDFIIKYSPKELTAYDIEWLRSHIKIALNQ